MPDGVQEHAQQHEGHHHALDDEFDRMAEGARDAVHLAVEPGEEAALSAAGCA